jgi:hypothetical protein
MVWQRDLCQPHGLTYERKPRVEGRKVKCRGSRAEKSKVSRVESQKQKARDLLGVSSPSRPSLTLDLRP